MMEQDIRNLILPTLFSHFFLILFSLFVLLSVKHRFFTGNITFLTGNKIDSFPGKFNKAYILPNLA